MSNRKVIIEVPKEGITVLFKQAPKDSIKILSSEDLKKENKSMAEEIMVLKKKIEELEYIIAEFSGGISHRNKSKD